MLPRHRYHCVCRLGYMDDGARLSIFHISCAWYNTVDQDLACLCKLFVRPVQATMGAAEAKIAGSVKKAGGTNKKKKGSKK
jgi:hypothetical protein